MSRCESRCAVPGGGTRCTLPKYHESRHRNGYVSWDHELIPNGTIEIQIRATAGDTE